MDSFFSLFNYTFKKDQRLRAIVKTVPQNAMYTSHDMQNEIAAMSSVVTKGILQVISTSLYTIKVDGTKNPSGVDNISIIFRFFKERFLKVAEHLLVLSNANSGDVNLITIVILAELAKAELTLSMVLSQVCDGASVMAGRCGGVQRLLQE